MPWAFGSAYIALAITFVLVSFLLVFLCAWMIRKINRSDGDGWEDGSDGGGGPPRNPNPPAPGGPDGWLPLDWGNFDDLRAGWERPRDRTPVGV